MENFKMYKKKREQYDNSVVLLPTPSSNYRLTASLVLFILHSPQDYFDPNHRHSIISSVNISLYISKR